MLEQERIWAWFRGETSSVDFNDLIREKALSQRQRLDTDGLLLGPVQALGLTRDVEEAQRRRKNGPGRSRWAVCGDRSRVSEGNPWICRSL